jgi:ATP-binding cassette subfamily F protein uup
VKRYAGGYSDWARLRHSLTSTDAPKSARTRDRGDARDDGKASQPRRKLSYKLQLELDALPDQIERLEQSIAALEVEFSKPEFYERPADAVSAQFTRLETLRADLERSMERWEALEAQRLQLSDTR